MRFNSFWYFAFVQGFIVPDPIVFKQKEIMGLAGCGNEGLASTDREKGTELIFCHVHQYFTGFNKNNAQPKYLRPKRRYSSWLACSASITCWRSG